MNIDTRKSRVQGGDTPEVKALRERVVELETKIDAMQKHFVENNVHPVKNARG